MKHLPLRLSTREDLADFRNHKDYEDYVRALFSDINSVDLKVNDPKLSVVDAVIGLIALRDR